VKEAFKDFLDRLLAHHAAATGGLPTHPRDPDVDPSFWQGPADASQWMPWRPIEKTAKDNFAELLPDLGPLHPSLDAFFNSYWFGVVDGSIGSWSLTLDAHLPGLWPRSFASEARNYAAAHGGKLEQVPIGVEADGLLLVVNNRTGEVGLEDFERGTVEPIAANLTEFFKSLSP
jgi:hypothetical protein